MKIYWVFGCDQYYPDGDNFLASFETEDEARNYILRCKANEENYPYGYDDYWITNITSRL